MFNTNPVHASERQNAADKGYTVYMYTFSLNGNNTCTCMHTGPCCHVQSILQQQMCIPCPCVLVLNHFKRYGFNDILDKINMHIIVCTAYCAGTCISCMFTCTCSKFGTLTFGLALNWVRLAETRDSVFTTRLSLVLIIPTLIQKRRVSCLSTKLFIAPLTTEESHPTDVLLRLC